MKTAGIVAEYNPFHNGHKYMAEKVRKMGADHVVAVMSGAAVQRGDIAVFDKHFRAKKAVENGVDLVLELPFPYSCSSGEIFARSAVMILAGLGRGVVDFLSFGCENDDISILKKTANVSELMRDNPAVKEKLSEGLSYPAAVCQTASEDYGNEIADVLRSPNNTLAVEYIKAAEKFLPNVKFMPIKRKNAEHDSSKISGDIASASAVRSLILSDRDFKSLCPYDTEKVPAFSLKVMEREVLFRLSCADKKQLSAIVDCSSETADRIIKTMSECPQTVEDFLQNCKSKNITMARLRRILMHCVLGTVNEDLCPPPYIRVLAFNRRGAEILSKCKNAVLPIDTSLKSLENSSEKAAGIIRLENNAVKFQQACAVGRYVPENEYRKSVRIME